MVASQGLALQFERHECKYLLDEHLAGEVRQRIAPFVDVDPHGKGRPDQRYPVSSLYLDTPSLHLYHETKEGLARRYKLRVRCYSESEDVPVFLEIKRRVGGLVSKMRAPIHRRDLESLIALREIASVPDGAKEQEAYRSFEDSLRRLGAVPILTVGYEREAYIGRVNFENRVTFDRALYTRAVEAGKLQLPTPDWESVECRKVILELKFNVRCPDWMSDMVSALGLKRISYSKYTTAVDACRRSLRWTIAGASG